MIMQYEILTSSIAFSLEQDSSRGADENLEAKVNEFIANGWRPQGGVSTVVLREDSDSKFTVLQQFQAMVKD